MSFLNKPNYICDPENEIIFFENWEKWGAKISTWLHNSSLCNPSVQSGTAVLKKGCAKSCKVSKLNIFLSHKKKKGLSQASKDYMWFSLKLVRQHQLKDTYQQIIKAPKVLKVLRQRSSPCCLSSKVKQSSCLPKIFWLIKKDWFWWESQNQSKEPSYIGHKDLVPFESRMAVCA